MALKQQLIDLINLDIEADMRTINRITSLIREILADGNARDTIMDKISKLPRSKLHNQSLRYNLLLNQKDFERMAKIEIVLGKIIAIVERKMNFLNDMIDT
jgi:hypothetical protein